MTNTFDVLVYLNTIQVIFHNDGYRSKFEVTRKKSQEKKHFRLRSYKSQGESKLRLAKKQTLII